MGCIQLQNMDLFLLVDFLRILFVVIFAVSKHHMGEEFWKQISANGTSFGE